MLDQAMEEQLGAALTSAAQFGQQTMQRVDAMKRTVLRKRWVSGESAVGQVVESELCTTAPGGLLSRDFHAVSLAEFHLDTAGRSQNDAKRLDELNAHLDAATPDQTHLVLSTTVGPRVLKRTTERFCALNPDRLILTKLDEAESLHKESLATRKKVHGDEHPDVALALNNLAELLSDQVRYKCKPFSVLLSAFAFVLLSHIC